MLTSGDMTLTVTFHNPIYDDLGNRKALGTRVEDALRSGLNGALTGRTA
jgi:hypothetical protein